MTDALIGYTGFVGSTLLKQQTFDFCYRSTNIAEIDGKQFDLVVCAAAPAKKWIANREPEADRQIIEGLIGHLKTIQCATFVLISTIDVFKAPSGVDETTQVDEDGLHAYGLHRRMLEQFVADHFTHHLIVRLPGLVGPGLRKNVIFDFLNHNNLHAIDSRGVFQFYPMVNLAYDIQTALRQGLNLVHLTAEPISVAEVAAAGFARPFEHCLTSPAARYDMRSIHAAQMNGRNGYQYSKAATLLAIRSYAQSEPITLTSSPAVQS
ncbi:MAG TPA: hypothetical protein VFK88_04670 [Gallionella sp.]|nr:hypothetical protein [Gallionella sp.]